MTNKERYEQTLRDYYKPGRIVTSYGNGYDRVIELKIGVPVWDWAVLVQAVLPAKPTRSPKATDEWKDDPQYPYPRWHSTYPDKREILQAYIINQDEPGRTDQCSK